MTNHSLQELFTETTSWTKDQAAAISTELMKYDEVDEIAYDIIGLAAKFEFKDILRDVKSGNFNWDSLAYKDYRESRDLEDNILENPPEIKEGETECPKCGQKKTLVVEMQTRSADEGYTYYIHCFNPKCKAITK